MADEPPKGPEGSPTIAGPIVPSEPPPMGTMQMPRGAVVPPDASKPPPLLSTMMPSSAATLPIGAPPAMPQDARYTMGPEIARGGMGRVVEATDTVLGRTVALKEALTGDPEAVRRFQREVKITARLEHPSIVPVHDAGFSAGGAPFYVMRKIGGRPLEELVGKHAALDERIALVPHIVAAAQALAHAHARGVVHRDIKPSNILVGDLGETIVIDWGLAKAIGEKEDPHGPVQRVIDPASRAKPDPLHIGDDASLKTRAGIVFGTPGFMAPEQLRGAPADERCDVYALGATLYHLLARKPPHYARDPEKMMRDAVAGPPPSLREIVPGVPPELSTIVDKALAFDHLVRYQNAGELAADLQRFLTGKLVAAHQYSTRERIERWVRQNRALVAVSGAAALTLLVGGIFSVHRIVGERDRADAEAVRAKQQERIALEQKEKVTESLHRLTLDAARTKAIDDPTRAVAMVKPLVTPDTWRQARDVAASARGHGVAFALPAAPHTLSLEMNRAGDRVLAGGDDGLVRIYDLGKRTQRALFDAKEPVRARFADGERTVIAIRNKQLTLVEVASGNHRDVALATPVADLAVSGPLAYWTDPDGGAWSLDLAAGAPQRLVVDDKIGTVAPSPDGRWIALGGATHLYILDRTQPAAAPERPLSGNVRYLAWSTDGVDLMALADTQLARLNVDTTGPAVAQKLTVGNRYAAAFANGRMYTAGPTGVMVALDESRGRKVPGEYTLGLREARGGVIVGGQPQGALVAITDDGDQLLIGPAGKLARFEASPRSSWIVAAADGVVLAWDLDTIQPKKLAGAASGAAFVTGDEVIASYVDGPAQWIDLRTNQQTPVGPLAAIASIAASPDALHAVVIDGMHHARMIARTGDAVDLEGDVASAAFLDDKRAAIAADAQIRAVGVDGKAQGVLFEHAAPIRALVHAGSWLAASADDGTLWRSNGKSETLKLPATPAAIAVLHDGTVAFAAGHELRAWRADGTTLTLAALDQAIVQLAPADAGRVVAITEGGMSLVAGTARANETEETGLMIGAQASAAEEGGLVVALAPSGALEAIDPVAKERWTIAAGKVGTFSSIALAPDGAGVLALTPSAVLVWRLGLPRTAADTSAWLDALTNAIADRGPTGPLGWK